METTYIAFLPALSAALCVALGLFTLSRSPRNPSNFGFALGMGSLAVVEVGNSIILFSTGESIVLGTRLLLAGAATVPASWLFFSLVFARSNYGQILLRNKLFLASIISACVYFILIILFRTGQTDFITIVQENSGISLITSGRAGKFFFVYLITGLVLCLVQLENTLRSSTGIIRWRIKYILFGVGAVLSFFIYLSSQALLFSRLSLGSLPVTSPVIIISVCVMGVFIVRHRLMEVDIFVSRYVVYNSVTVIIVGLYLIATGLIAEGIRYFGVPHDYAFKTLFVFVALLALFILLFTAGLRRKAQLFINRHFYKHKYEFRDKWMETIERVGSKGSVEEVEKTLKEMVAETMGARDIYLWLFDPVSNDYLLKDNSLPQELRRIKQDHPLVDAIIKSRVPFLIEERSSGDRPEQISSLASATGTALCTPLVSGENLVGFILQGRDLSGEMYKQDDFDIMRALASQAAIQISNIKLAKYLLNVKEIEAFSNMSSFIMHDLKNLTNSLSLVSQNAEENMGDPEFQRDTIRTIDSIVKRMKGLIGKLSSMPKGIEICSEPTDLKALVEESIKKLPLKPGGASVINSMAEIQIMNIDPQAMEMIFFNLLTNAYDAVPKDGRITVGTDLKEGTLEISVSDNGCGISREFIENSLFRPFKTTKKSGFGIGLFQCKTLIEAHGGRIEVESALGIGTTFKICLPAPPDKAAGPETAGFHS